MKSAETTARELYDERHNSGFQTRLADAIRAAQIDAAEWMREEIAVRLEGGIAGNLLAAGIRAIKLPGDGE